MNTIEWSDALQLDFEPMDAVHQAFVHLLAMAQSAPDDALAQTWSAVIDHTVDHFGREDAWMLKTGFSSADNHILQHRVVLNVMREGLVMARAGDFKPVREMATELAAWFAKHTQSLDAALALHMRRQAEEHPPAPRHRPRAAARAKAAHPH
jgi:hemerythrin-like metal-binding protein